MAFKDIAVHIDATPAGQERVRIAVRIASHDGAYLTGLFIRTPHAPPPPGLPRFSHLGLETGAFPDEEFQRRIAEEEKALPEGEEAFRQATKEAGVNGEWLVLDGGVTKPIDAQARYADLVVAGPMNMDERARYIGAIFPGELALACGRPVLAVPSTGKLETLAERVLIAWNASREAARAVSDAMPFLVHADFVTMLAVEPPWGDVEDGMRELSNLGRHLEHCGVSAERYVVKAPEHTIGEEILARAEDSCCDLVVMGAYGHSHMREIVLGGATRTLLESIKTPILLSH